MQKFITDVECKIPAKEDNVVDCQAVNEISVWSILLWKCLEYSP